MRGDKFIGGIGAQSATVFAGRIGPQAFKLRNRWTHAVTVADIGAGSYGFAGVSGKMEPSVWSGQQIVSFGATSADILFANFADDPVGNVDPLLVKLDGIDFPIELPWEGPADAYRETVPGINQFFSDRVGKVVGVRFARGNVGA